MTDFYVRPYRNSVYGSNNGTTYADAWQGLDGVLWDGAAGVEVNAGDTLWVCGTHGLTYTGVGWGGSIYARDLITVGVSGSEGSPVTIRCDVDNAPDTNAHGTGNGIIYGTSKLYPGAGGTNWVDTGTNGVYGAALAFNESANNFFSVHSGSSIYQLLFPKITISNPPTAGELNTFVAGSQARLADVSQTFLPAAVDTVNNWITIAGTWLEGAVVQFTNSGGALPGGLAVNTRYWVVYADSGNYKVSTTSGGSPVTLTSQGTGTHTIKNCTFQLYVKPPAGANANPNTVGETYMSSILDRGVSITAHPYITVSNLTIINGYVDLINGSHSCIVSSCNISYGRYGVDISNVGPSNSVQITNNTIDKCVDGIYLRTNAAAPSTDVLIDGNTITDCQDFGTGFASTDNHAIGIMGGTGHIVRNNTVNGGQSGPYFYSAYNYDGSWECYNNYIHDITFVDAHGIGIESMIGAAQNAANPVTALIHNNIIVNCSVKGIEVNTWATQDVAATRIWNNVIDQCAIGMRVIGDTLGAIVADVQNNIITNPTTLFAMAISNEVYANWYLTWDHNCYYPDVGTGDKFATGTDGNTRTFAEWKSDIGNQDANSIASDPLFLNAGGSYALDTDFQLQTSSPCKNAGVDVSLTQDYGGFPIKGLPDIGAWELQVVPNAILFGVPF